MNCGTLLGRSFSAQNLRQRELLALEAVNFRNKSIIEFKNVICNGVKHSTLSYCEHFKRNNSIVQIEGDNFGRILKIVEIRNRCFFIVEILKTKIMRKGNTTISHIGQVDETEKKVIKIIEPHAILGSCVSISITSKTHYICTMPNIVEIQ